MAIFFELSKIKIMSKRYSGKSFKDSSVNKKPEIVDKVYQEHKNDSLNDLELQCKKFINEELFDYAWTIISIIEER